MTMGAAARKGCGGCGTTLDGVTRAANPERRVQDAPASAQPISQRREGRYAAVAEKARVERPIPPVVAPDDGDAPARRRGRTSLVGGQPNGNTGAGSMRKDLRTQPGLATPAGKQSRKKPDHSRGCRFAGDDRDETSGVPGVRQCQLAEENTSVSALQPSNLGHLAATDVPQQDVPGRHGRPASALSSAPGAGGGVSPAGPAKTSPPSFAVPPANPGPQGFPAPDAAGGAAPMLHSHPDPSSTHSTAAAPGSDGRPSLRKTIEERTKVEGGA